LQSLSTEHILEALLFVADGPVLIGDIARVLEVDAPQIDEAARNLARALEARGLRLVREGDRLQLVSAPEAASFVERFLGLDTSRSLSPAALETLAIIAYRKPITRAEIEAIRGVNSDTVLRRLLASSLIQAVGRMETAGRPVLYGTTFEFLQYFGIRSPEELPPLSDSEPGPAQRSDDEARKESEGGSAVSSA
jgi:segregation and condensation protein B